MNSREEDQSANNTPIRSSFEEERLVQAKSLLQPFCLRRLKSQVSFQTFQLLCLQICSMI